MEQRAAQLKPYQFKKGQSGNPAGRPPKKEQPAAAVIDGDFKKWVAAVVESNASTFADDLKELKPYERIKVILKLLPYILPPAERERADEGGGLLDAWVALSNKTRAAGQPQPQPQPAAQSDDDLDVEEYFNFVAAKGRGFGQWPDIVEYLGREPSQRELEAIQEETGRRSREKMEADADRERAAEYLERKNEST